MPIKIDSVLKNAVGGVEQGLSQARQASSQLAIASPDPEDAATDDVSKAKVVKDPDETLGNFVDIKV